MKKKGFTLIELLAVIVVLAIIALIATPIVMNVIKNASMGAAERSADNYVKAVETLIATEKLDGNTIADGSYTITSTGKLTIDGKDYEVEVSGTKPVGGTIRIENGQVVKDETSIKVGDYTVTYEDGVAKAEDGESKKLMTLADCDFLEEDTHNEGRNPNTVGAKYSCDLGPGARTFYVLEAGTESKPATLILEGNYDTETLAWCASGSDNSCAADGLTAKLDDIVENAWIKLDRSQIGLPSASQIVVADGQEEDADWGWATLSNSWLCGTAYWTSTPIAGSSDYAWLVNSYGSVVDGSVDSGSHSGVRPIIMLSL